MRRLIRLQIIALLFVIAFYSVYAFAASETTDRPTGGEGTSPIGGWIVSDVHFQPGQDASMISAVEFDLDSAASYSCVNVSGTPSHSLRSGTIVAPYAHPARSYCAGQVTDVLPWQVCALCG